MNQFQNVDANQQGAVQQSQRPMAKQVELMKNIINMDDTQKRFRDVVGKNFRSFLASVLDLFKSDKKMIMCNPKLVLTECMKAAMLGLPINRGLGFAWIIPYWNSKMNAYNPTFQLGYKGYIQLALRTNQYRTINCGKVLEGELKVSNKLTGELVFVEPTSNKVVGYFAYLELLSGFKKSVFVSVEDIARHAKTYSKSLKEYTIDVLVTLANTNQTGGIGWSNDFSAMAKKTVLLKLLKEYGYLSIEMQNAISSETEEDVIDIPYEEKKDEEKVISMDSLFAGEQTQAPQIQSQKAPDASIIEREKTAQPQPIKVTRDPGF